MREFQMEREICDKEKVLKTVSILFVDNCSKYTNSKRETDGSPQTE
jgi:hypothetical protein